MAGAFMWLHKRKEIRPLRNRLRHIHRDAVEWAFSEFTRRCACNRRGNRRREHAGRCGRGVGGKTEASKGGDCMTTTDAQQPITEAWLSANAWKTVSPRNDTHTQTPGFQLRPIGHELAGPRSPFHSFDDLCIAVAQTGSDGTWFVWIYQMEPYRHIHVRHMRYTHELVKLWEGLTGRDWPQVESEPA
jgi:hypothetical protein